MIRVQVDLTHAVLTASSKRLPGHPPDACDGEIIPLQTPDGAEPGLSLLACKGCLYRIVTKRISPRRWEIVNEYEGGEIRPEELPVAEPAPDEPTPPVVDDEDGAWPSKSSDRPTPPRPGARPATPVQNGPRGSSRRRKQA